MTRHLHSCPQKRLNTTMLNDRKRHHDKKAKKAKRRAEKKRNHDIEMEDLMVEVRTESSMMQRLCSFSCIEH